MNKAKLESITPQQALEDIAFIKQLISRNQQKLNDGAPFLLIWGFYVMVGYIGMQFNQVEWPIWFWSSGSIIGGILSAIAGNRISPKSSNVQQGGASTWMFWLPPLIMAISGCFMMATGIVKLEYLSFFWFILIGLLYVSMGPLLGKGPIYLGSWFIVLSMLTRLFFLDYQYLILGLLGGGSIVIVGYLLRQRSLKHG